MKEKNLMKMNSKTYIKKQFEILDLVPQKFTPNKRHLFADYFELSCLFSNDELSQTDFLSKYEKENIDLVIIENDYDEIGSLKADADEKNELWANAIYSICEERKSQLGDNYPFELFNKSIDLKKSLCDENKIYLFLLLSSNLNYFKEFESILTSDFEEVSFQSLRGFLPKSAIVKQLGKNSDLSGTTAKKKILELADLMNIRFNQKEIEDNVRGNQERGLDIVGWIPYNDKIPNFVSILGQCACGKEWYKKQGETRRYENAYYNFYRNKPIHAMFIPYALIRDSSSFYQSDEVDCLLFERLRILENIKDTNFFNSLETKKIVNECIKHSVF